MVRSGGGGAVYLKLSELTCSGAPWHQLCCTEALLYLSGLCIALYAVVTSRGYQIQATAENAHALRGTAGHTGVVIKHWI